MDYLPVLFFGVTAVLLLRDLYNKMFKGAYALLAAGSINVFLAGFCSLSNIIRTRLCGRLIRSDCLLFIDGRQPTGFI